MFDVIYWLINIGKIKSTPMLQTTIDPDNNFSGLANGKKTVTAIFNGQ